MGYQCRPPPQPMARFVGSSVHLMRLETKNTQYHVIRQCPNCEGVWLILPPPPPGTVDPVGVWRCSKCSAARQGPYR